MNKQLWTRYIPAAILGTVISVSAIAWQTHPAHNLNNTTDTVPDRNKKVKDIDDAIDALDKGRAEMDRSLNKVELDKMQEDIRQAMKEIDAQKIKMQVDAAMREVDMQKIKTQIDKAMKQIDIQKMQADAQKEIASIDGEKIKAEVERAMKQLDKGMDEMRRSLDNIDMEKIKANVDKSAIEGAKKAQDQLRDLGPTIERSLKQAQLSMDKAREELRGYKELIDGLDSDGLLDKKSNYTIEYKKGQLSVNGKKQPDQVVKKYSRILSGHKDFELKKDSDDFNINGPDEVQ